MDKKDMEKNLNQIAYQVTGADTHVKSRESRINQTPVNGVVWSGGRGSSKCYPTDKKDIAFLQRYGREYVSYDRTGEPDFSPFETVNVRITDMGNERQKNFSSAGKKLLQTEWAKENGITSLAELEAYKKEHNLTWHECSDGVTMRLVPTELNARYGHGGGVSELGENQINIIDDGLSRTIGKLQGKVIINTNKAFVKVEDGIKEIGNAAADLAESLNVPTVGISGVQNLTNAGVDFVSGARESFNNASFQLMNQGIQNLYQVAAGEKSLEEAGCEMAETTARLTVTGGTMNLAKNALLDAAQNLQLEPLAAAADNLGPAAQVMTIAAVVGKSFIKLLNCEIDGNEFFNEISQHKESIVTLIASLSSNPIVAAATAAYMSVMTISAVCTQTYAVVSNLCRQYIAKREAYAKELSAINQVMDEAISDMKYQQMELKKLIDERNNTWGREFESGFQMIMESMMSGDLEELSGGINQVLLVFDKHVLFHNIEEFDDFFFNDEAVLTI